MIRKGLLSLLLSSLGLTAMLAQGVTLTGKVVDEKGEPVPFATIAVFKNGISKTGGQSDFDGAFRINNIDPGSYDVECSQVGKTTQKQTGVKLTSGIIDLKFKLVDNGKVLDVVQIVAYKVPLVKVDQTSQGGTLTSEQIRALPTRDVNALAAITAGVSSNAKGDELNFRGSRKEGTNYYIDGIRVRGNSIPANEIEQLQVITGGIDAKYGDVTGGIISISTKGPARKFTGGLEVESSQYLDAFGSNFLAGNLSGPILSRTYTDKTNTKVKETVLGFRMSGQVRQNLDKDPSAVPVYRVKSDVLKQLEEHPYTTIGAGTRVASGERLTINDFDKLKINPGNKYAQYDFTGKLDARLNKAMDVTLSGALFRAEDQQDGDDRLNRDEVNPWRTFNSDYNPTGVSERYRVNFRFRHRLGGGSTNTEGATRGTGTTIENAQYQLQIGYEQLGFKISDPRHGDNFFNYGYVGKFKTDYLPVLATDTSGTHHIGFRKAFTGYELSDINRVLANYNRDASGKALDLDPGGNNMNIFNSQYNLGNLRDVYTFHQNVGQVYDWYRKDENLQATASASLNFDILPNGSKEKAHNIEMGFLYEQRTDRQYTLRPFELWRVAGALQNGNINGFGVDTLSKSRDSLVNGVKIPIYNALENKDIKAQTDLRFYQNVRDRFGIPYLNFADVDRLDPSKMTLDLFTARELNDAQTGVNNDKAMLSYRGFDYLGNRIATGKYSFNDFFKATDGQGTRIFPVAPLQPLYIGGYIQDKFRYKDVIFSLGLRVDRFDANTKVLKDQYSLYDVMTAKDFYANVLKKEKPSSVGDDYKVYINSNTFGKTAVNYTESNIKGFRQGDQWFDAKGQPLDPVALFGESAQAFVKYVSDTFNTITQRGYDPNLSFTDYKPQTTLMPRLAFSFPIGEKANFFAHYDILAQRPTVNQVTALDYFYFDERAGNTTQQNANLKPERTIDYEVGFQQELTPVSALKLSAYYKEMRDMVQLRYIKYLPAPLKTTEYQTYDNVDFGTVKGFSIAYDLRRTNHFSANLSYLLQFANGTGSDAASSNGLNRRGSIRTLSPLNYDERHSIKLNCDYRYDDGAYDGPKLFGVDLFKNAGANIQVVAISGRPYTKRRTPTPFSAAQIDGLINSSTLPWQFSVDARVDKTITFAKNLSVNVFLRVQNLLDKQNVADVYKASGEPGNDGFLKSTNGLQTLDNVKNSRPEDLEAYRQSYLMRLINPDFYFFPRRIFVGAVFDF
jgi:Carboxypeptidase regulatory-like domain/TonB-dependent Receptor Plug Domain